MAEAVVDTLRIDVCRRCQALWFDHREIAALPPRLEPPDRPLSADPLRERAIMQVTEMQRRYQQGEANGGAPDDIWKKVVGVLGLPVEIGAMVTAQRPWVTWSLVAAIIITWLMSVGFGLNAAVREFGFLPAQPWRLGGLTVFTAFFLHATPLHLIGNVYLLWLAGDNVEEALGRWRFLALVALATLIGMVAHAGLDPRSDRSCIGASGGISGILAVYVLIHPRAWIGRAWFYGRLWIRFPAWTLFALWALVQLWMAWGQISGVGRVSALAHLGGVVTGVGFWAVWQAGRRFAPAQPTATRTER